MSEDTGHQCFTNIKRYVCLFINSTSYKGSMFQIRYDIQSSSSLLTIQNLFRTAETHSQGSSYIDS